MAREILGYEFEMPFMPAGGAINGHNLELIDVQVRDVIRSPAAAANVGTTTPARHEGNPGRAYHHDSKTGTTVNALQFPNEGLSAILDLVPELTEFAEGHGKLIFWNIASLPGDDPTSVIPVMAEKLLEAGAQAIEVNLGCRSFEGGVLGHNIDAVQALRDAMRQRIGVDQNWTEKWPALSEGKAVLAKGLAENMEGIKVVTASNSFPIHGQYRVDGEVVLDAPPGTGGKSDRATRGLARYSLMLAAHVLPPNIAIISANGVDDGFEVFQRTENQHGLVERRALLTSGVTALMEGEKRGLSYGQTITRMAEEYADVPERVASGN